MICWIYGDRFIELDFKIYKTCEFKNPRIYFIGLSKYIFKKKSADKELDRADMNLLSVDEGIFKYQRNQNV